MNNLDCSNATILISIISTSILALAAIIAIVFNILNLKKIEKSITVTKEKENTDRAIGYLERFENLRPPLFNLTKKKQLKSDNGLPVIDLNDEGTWYEIRDIIIFLIDYPL